MHLTGPRAEQLDGDFVAYLEGRPATPDQEKGRDPEEKTSSDPESEEAEAMANKAARAARLSLKPA